MRETMNYHTVEFSDGHAVMEGTPLDAHRNMDGKIHGGWYMTILDSAMGMAIMSTCSEDQRAPSITLEYKFLRPLTVGTTYQAIGDVVNVGKTIAHATGKIVDPATGKVMGTSAGTFAITITQK